MSLFLLAEIEQFSLPFYIFQDSETENVFIYKPKKDLDFIYLALGNLPAFQVLDLQA